MKLAFNSSVNSRVKDCDLRSSAPRVRPLLAAGIALAGAGLIAANPVAPSIAGLAERAVELTSVADAVGLAPYGWFDVLAQTATQLGITLQDWLADPFPIVSQLITNLGIYGDITLTSLIDAAGGLGTFLFGTDPGDLVPSLDALITDLQAGDFYSGPDSGVAADLNNIFFNGIYYAGYGLVHGGIFTIPVDIANHVQAIACTLFGYCFEDLPAPTELVNIGYPGGDATTLASIFAGAVGSFEAGIYQAGASAEAAVEAFDAGKYATGLVDILDIPSSYTYGLLDGIVDGCFDQPGLLTAIDGFNAFEPVAGGLFPALFIALPQAIANDMASMVLIP